MYRGADPRDKLAPMTMEDLAELTSVSTGTFQLTKVLIGKISPQKKFQAKVVAKFVASDGREEKIFSAPWPNFGDSDFELRDATVALFTKPIQESGWVRMKVKRPSKIPMKWRTVGSVQVSAAVGERVQNLALVLNESEFMTQLSIQLKHVHTEWVRQLKPTIKFLEKTEIPLTAASVEANDAGFWGPIPVTSLTESRVECVMATSR